MNNKSCIELLYQSVGDSVAKVININMNKKEEEEKKEY